MTAPETIWAYPELYMCVPTEEEPAPENAVIYARTDICIRRDDPVLRQVIGSLTFLEKQLDRHGFREDGHMLSAVSGALAAMQELIGGKDG